MTGPAGRGRIRPHLATAAEFVEPRPPNYEERALLLMALMRGADVAVISARPTALDG